ncbi:hypothetical protein MKX01_005309 [Papaver californicum]|nr:hypothetical protein MKX01_005309 [Papaver californicum]
MSSSSTNQSRGRVTEREGKILDDSNNNPSSASASASFIGGNVDILTLILTGLPSKSLLVFKSVSKQWLFIITDPQFVHKHFIQNPRFSIPGLFWGDDLSLGIIPKYDYITLDGNTNSYVPFGTLTFAEDKWGIKILQSCNGLLLCRSCSLSISNFPYYIFNPFTNKYKILPQPQLGSSHRFVCSVSLAFDPFKSPYYKVIAFWSNFNSSCDEYRIEIYDSETSSWRLSGFYTCTPKLECIPCCSAIFWNGSLYWCHLEGCIFYFDIDRELVGVVPVPNPNPVPEYDYIKTFYIAEYLGHFYLIEKDCPHDHFSFSIFERDAAYSSWNLKGHVDMSLNPYVKFAASPTGTVDYIVFIMQGEEEKESTKVFLIANESMVVSYDLKDMIFEKIYDLSTREEFPEDVSFHQHIESLACV